MWIFYKWFTFCPYVCSPVLQLFPMQTIRHTTASSALEFESDNEESDMDEILIHSSWPDEMIQVMMAHLAGKWKERVYPVENTLSKYIMETCKKLPFISTGRHEEQGIPSYPVRCHTVERGLCSELQQDEALVRFVSMDMQPFSVVSVRCCVAFCKALDKKYRLPTRKTLTRVPLPQLFEETHKNTTKVVSQAASVSLTTLACGALGPTQPSSFSLLFLFCHFCDKDGELSSSKALECFIMHGSYTGEAIKNEIEKMLVEYEIDKAKLLTVVTDIWSNIVKAIQEMGSSNALPTFSSWWSQIATKILLCRQRLRSRLPKSDSNKEDPSTWWQVQENSSDHGEKAQEVEQGGIQHL